ncbi:positive regulator AgmR [Vibrio cholerae]|nr:positive regulator AgmR [Vibrio cholerae]TYA08220.1 positive regulator AgmR [Vibrio cholerae]
MKLLNYQRFLPRKYPIKARNLTRELSTH